MQTNAPDTVESIDAPNYSYHREPVAQGGRRYVRCEGCGTEAIPARPERIPHRDGCPVSDDV